MTLTLGGRLTESSAPLVQTACAKCGERTITWLGREVAGEIFAERFSHRFEYEARVGAALNRPNIGTLHDVSPNYL